MDPEIERVLQDEGIDWVYLTKKLLRYAGYLVQFKGDMLKQDDMVLSHLSLHDLVFNAIEKFLDGTRNWNPERCSLEQLIRGIIRSDLYRLREQHARQPDVLRPVPEEILVPLSDAGREAVSPATHHIAGLQKVAYETRFRQHLEQAADEDADLQNVILAMMDGITTARKMAKELKIDVERVYDLKRRLKRVAQRIQQDLQEGGGR